jgi:hypothetical protein
MASGHRREIASRARSSGQRPKNALAAASGSIVAAARSDEKENTPSSSRALSPPASANVCSPLARFAGITALT